MTPDPSDAEFERQTLRATRVVLTHIDDPERIEFYRAFLLESEAPTAVARRMSVSRRLLTMLAWDSWIR